MVVVDSKREHIAVAEARAKNIPIISIMGSDCDLAEAAYPVLGNDSSKKSIEFFVQELVDSYATGKANAPKKVPAPAAKPVVKA